MKFEARRRWIHAGLAVLSLWPAVQLGLSLRYDVSSWKLAGWGMYATPQSSPGLQLRGSRGGVPVVPYAAGRPVWLGDALQRFARHRRAFGALHAPDALGAAILADRPALDEVWLDVVELRLDRGSAMLERRRSRYHYVREAASP